MEELETPKIPRLSLHRAVRARKVDLVKSLLLSGTNVNAKDCHKQTALYLACAIDDEFEQEDVKRIVELLLKSGAEVNVQDYRGRTALHEACSKNKQRCVQALLKHGAKISVVDRTGKTPLHYTFLQSWGYKFTPLVKILITINTPDCSMESRHLHLAHSNEDEDILAVLNVQDNDGSTVLHLAASQDHKELVYLLLRKGAKVGLKDNRGKTALHCAAEAHAGAVFDVLVEYGAYVNAKDSSGNTPLHLACSFLSFTHSTSFEPSTVEELLSKGAKASEKNVRQKTPIEELHDHCSFFSQENGPLALRKDKYGRKTLLIEETFIKHVILKREFEQHDEFDIKWKSDQVVCDEIKNACSREIEDMKCTKIVKDITLYQVILHTNQPYLLLPDELLLIDDYLEPLDVMIRFPLYCNSLQFAWNRSKLLTLAVHSFYSDRRKLMWKKLPYEMTEHLVTFLSNADLSNFLKSE